jgi:4-hydroxybenzoate polyprenyltransferase
VWLLAAAGLLLGWLLLLALSKSAAVCGFGLLTVIVVYDLVHKRTQWAVLLMAACRFLLYFVAAAAGSGGVNLAVATRAVALASYITGLSCLARGESTRVLARTWPIGLLFVPLLVSLIAAGPRGTGMWLPASASLLWVLWCLRRGLFSDRRDFRHGIAGLLAGIVLVDWLAAGGVSAGLGVVFCGLFVLALILQRVAPAT